MRVDIHCKRDSVVFQRLVEYIRPEYPTSLVRAQLVSTMESIPPGFLPESQQQEKRRPINHLSNSATADKGHFGRHYRQELDVGINGKTRHV